MQDLGYLKPKKSELFPITIITFILALMFSILILKISNIQNDLTNVFIPIFLLLNFLFHTKLFFSKLMGLKHGIELTFDLTYMTQYGFRQFDKFQSRYPDLPSKGFSTILLSFLFYIVTLGYLIIPTMWRIKYQKINHLYLGSGHHHELGFAYNKLYEVTDMRIVKTLVMGFLSYFIIAQFIEIFFKNSELYIWFQAIIFYIAFFTIIPIPGFEGFELYKRSHSAYVMLLPVLSAAMLSIVVFDSVIFTTLAVLLVFAYLYFEKLWHDMLHGGH